MIFEQTLQILSVLMERPINRFVSETVLCRRNKLHELVLIQTVEASTSDSRRMKLVYLCVLLGCYVTVTSVTCERLSPILGNKYKDGDTSTPVKITSMRFILAVNVTEDPPHG